MSIESLENQGKNSRVFEVFIEQTKKEIGLEDFPNTFFEAESSFDDDKNAYIISVKLNEREVQDEITRTEKYLFNLKRAIKNKDLIKKDLEKTDVEDNF